MSYISVPLFSIVCCLIFIMSIISSVIHFFFFLVKFYLEYSHLLTLLNFLFEFSFLCCLFAFAFNDVRVHHFAIRDIQVSVIFCNLNAALVFFNFHSFISCKTAFPNLLMIGMGGFYGYICI